MWLSVFSYELWVFRNACKLKICDIFLVKWMTEDHLRTYDNFFRICKRIYWRDSRARIWKKLSIKKFQTWRRYLRLYKSTELMRTPKVNWYCILIYFMERATYCISTLRSLLCHVDRVWTSDWHSPDSHFPLKYYFLKYRTKLINYKDFGSLHCATQTNKTVG